MAIMLCDKHNKQAGIFTSENLADSMIGKSSFNGVLYALKLNLFVGVNYHWVDEKFLQENNIGTDKNSLQIEVTDEEAAFEIYSKLVPVCSVCYNEYLNTNNLCRPKEVKGNLW